MEVVGIALQKPVFVGLFLEGFLKRLIKGFWELRMLFGQFRSHADGMHDGKYSCFLKITPFSFSPVWKKPLNLRFIR